MTESEFQNETRQSLAHISDKISALSREVGEVKIGFTSLDSWVDKVDRRVRDLGDIVIELQGCNKRTIIAGTSGGGIAAAIIALTSLFIRRLLEG